MLRYFKSPAPAREISMVTIKGFVKTRLSAILKSCIIENLPEEITRKKKLQRVDI